MQFVKCLLVISLAFSAWTGFADAHDDDAHKGEHKEEVKKEEVKKEEVKKTVPAKKK